MIEIGIIGGALILAAWLFETYESVKNHRSLIDLKFAFIYVIGVTLLAVYGNIIGDPIFFFLNTAILSIVLFEIVHTILLKRKK